MFMFLSSIRSPSWFTQSLKPLPTFCLQVNVVFAQLVCKPEIHSGYPSLHFMGGMWENKSQRTIKRQKPFLIFHNCVISVVISQCVAFCVFVNSFFILWKIAVVTAFHICVKVSFQDCIFFFAHKFVVTFFKHLSVDALTSILCTVFFYFIYKEQWKDFYTFSK